MANTPKQITVQIKTLPESAHALLDGILADVWDECSEQWISDLGYGVQPPDNPYRKRLDEKPEPTYDELFEHLNRSHNRRWSTSLSLKRLREYHSYDHDHGLVRHEKDDLS